MEPPKTYLRGSDCHLPIAYNGSVWRDDYAPIGIIFAGAGLAFAIGLIFTRVMSVTCQVGHKKFCVEKTVSDSIPVILGTMGFIGTIVYGFFRCSQTGSQNDEARHLIKNYNEIVSRSKYN